MPPKISIITPSYNQAAFLEQTMFSVTAQTYPNFEYLVVDGDSSDGSQAVIQRFADRLAWWVSEPDRGQADAINKGIRRASGEIVAWLNSDDLYLPGALEAAANAFRAHPDAGLVFGDVLSVDADGRVINIMRAGDWTLQDLMKFQIISQPGVFMRRAVLEKAGWLDLDYQYLLDHHLWLRIAAIAPIRHVPQVWAAARFHPAAKNVAHAARFGQEARRIVEWMSGDERFSGVFQPEARVIRAAAARFDARYLLDGGLPGAAWRAYMESLRLHPGTALREWTRILFTPLAMLGLGGVRQGLLALRRRLRRRKEPYWYDNRA